MGKRKKETSFKADVETINKGLSAVAEVQAKVKNSVPDLSSVPEATTTDNVTDPVVGSPATAVQDGDPTPLGFICLKLATFGIVRREDIYPTRGEAIRAAVKMQGPHMVAPVW